MFEFEYSSREEGLFSSDIRREIAPNYFSDSIDIRFDIHRYDLRGMGSMNGYFAAVYEEIFRNTFCICTWLRTLERSARFCEENKGGGGVYMMCY